ncbi:MAG: rhomboid family intramembrane serine protease [Acidobacteriota bacterium]|nr:rhomboid family intramembrane serine protease [Acidobacteriota bacterium]
MPLLLFVNVLVFAGWQAARVLEPAGDLLTSHFLVSTDHLADGRFWSLLGATFSHSQVWHLVLNMIVLLSFGSILERIWGFRLFAGFYVAAGLASSLAHCAVSTYLLGRSDLPALGASGALAGLLVAYALSFPRQRLLLFGVIRMPAYIAAVGLVSLDIWGLLAQGSGGGLPIGHGAHLGGAAAGLLFYLAVIRARR